MKVACASCRQPIAGSGVDLASASARCGQCEAVTKLPDLRVPKPYGPVSEAIKGLSEPELRSIVWREAWESGSFTVALSTAGRAKMLVFLHGIAWMAVALATVAGVFQGVSPPLLAVWGLFVALHALYVMNNRARLRLTPASFELRHEPLPALRTFTCNTDAIVYFNAELTGDSDNSSYVLALHKASGAQMLRVGTSKEHELSQIAARLNYALLRVQAGVCPSCARPIPPSDRDARSSWGVCRPCGEVVRQPVDSVEALIAAGG